jgi:hypothetical protein
MTFAFDDRHRCQNGFRIVEQPGQLLVEPKAFPVRASAIWMIFVHVIMIILMAPGRVLGVEPEFFPIVLVFMALEFLTFMAILHAFNRSELAKGPLLEVDTSRRVATLLRDGTALDFDDIQTVLMIAGWYNRGQGEGWDWEAEMSLIVQEKSVEPSQWPVLRHGYVKEVDDLAVRVAEWVDKPVERVTLKWKDRRKPARRLEKLS